MSVLGIDGDQLGHEMDAPSRHDGPQILLCTEGSAVVHAKSSVVTLERAARRRGSGRPTTKWPMAGRPAADQAFRAYSWASRVSETAAHGRCHLAALIANAGRSRPRSSSRHSRSPWTASMLAESVHRCRTAPGRCCRHRSRGADLLAVPTAEHRYF